MNEFKQMVEQQIEEVKKDVIGKEFPLTEVEELRLENCKLRTTVIAGMQEKVDKMKAETKEAIEGALSEIKERLQLDPNCKLELREKSVIVR